MKLEYFLKRIQLNYETMGSFNLKEQKKNKTR